MSRGPGRSRAGSPRSALAKSANGCQKHATISLGVPPTCGAHGLRCAARILRAVDSRSARRRAVLRLGAHFCSIAQMPRAIATRHTRPPACEHQQAGGAATAAARQPARGVPGRRSRPRRRPARATLASSTTATIFQSAVGIDVVAEATAKIMRRAATRASQVGSRLRRGYDVVRVDRVAAREGDERARGSRRRSPPTTIVPPIPPPANCAVRHRQHAPIERRPRAA